MKLRATIFVVMMLVMSSMSMLGTLSQRAQAGDVLNPTSTYRLPCTDLVTILEDSPGATFTGFGSMWYTEAAQQWSPYYSDNITENRPYMNFDYASLPSGLAIQQVKLWFYVEQVVTKWDLDWEVGVNNPYDPVEFYVLTPWASWDMYTINWTNQPYNDSLPQYYITGYSIPRISPNGFPGNSTANTTEWQTFDTWFSIDVTYQSQLWYNGVPNYGFVFVADTYFGNNSNVGLGSLKAYNPWSQEPYIEVIATSKLCQVHISYFDSFTGEGLAPWTFNVSASLDNGPFARIAPDITDGLFGKNLTIRVKDFFGNELYNYTQVILASVFYWDIGLPIYSYKFYNQNPRFAMLEIYYNLAGQPYSEFIPPNDVVNRYLKAGTYRFNITFYSEIGVRGDEYTWVRTIPSVNFPGAGFVILKGDTISEVIDAVTGVQALVKVVVQLVSPSVLWMGRDIPQIPSNILAVSTSVVINNLYMLTASTNQIQTGNLLDFTSPIPDSVQDSVIPRDYFRFSGPYSTTVFINDTNTGENRYNATTIPPSVAVTGSGAYEVDTSNNVTCSREVDFRWYRAFTWHYYPGENNKYTVELAIENSLVTPWLNATLFIPFMNSSYVNNQSVVVYDMNNTVDLLEGIHWLQSEQGVYMWFSQWNASVWRGFRLTYNSVNESNFNAPVHIVVNKVGDDSGVTYIWNKDTFYFAKASWTNSYRQTYHGSIYIDLTFDMSVDTTTVRVLTPTGNVISDIIVAGKTIIIPEVITPVGTTLDYVVIFKSVQKNNIFDMEFANIPIVVTAGFIALAAFILGIFFTQFRKGDKKSEAWGRIFIGLAVLALMLVVVVFIYFLGVMA